jgi:hypothetical protein
MEAKVTKLRFYSKVNNKQYVERNCDCVRASVGA